MNNCTWYCILIYYFMISNRCDAVLSIATIQCTISCSLQVPFHLSKNVDQIKLLKLFDLT